MRLQKQIITATWNIKQKADSSGKMTKDEDMEVVRQSQQDALNQAGQALEERKTLLPRRSSRQSTSDVAGSA